MRKTSMHFEKTLDDCITAIREQGRTVADCLARYPTQREELEPLLRLAVRLQAAGTLQAPPEFRRVSAIRVRNLVAARPRRSERAAAEPNPLRRIQGRLQAIFWVQGRLPAVVTISIVLAVGLLVGSGTVYASAYALPGDALYTAKKAVESVQLAVSLNDAGDARLYLAFATRRLDEVAALLEEDRPQDIGQALADYEAQMESVLASFGEDSDLSSDEQVALADRLVTAQAHHEAQLAVLLGQVTKATRLGIEVALTASQAARDRALETLRERPGRPEYLPDENLPELPGDTPAGPPEASPRPPTETPAPTSAPTCPPVPTSLPEPPEWPTPPVSLEWATPPASLEWPTPPASLEWPTPPASLEWATPPEPPKWPTPPEPPEWPDPSEWPTPPEWPGS